ncbi:MAG: transglutaminase family protein [Lachnospiraceae bacterium]|nr:transglutaminase family protein [Lachnospiraceae bacterium]
MKRLRFRYELDLKWDQAVWDHHFLIRCLPVENGCQHREALDVRIEPAETIDVVRDGFGNEGYAGAIRRPHDRLFFEAKGVVQVDRSGETEPFHPMYRFPSAYTMPDEGIRQFFGEIGKELGMESVSEGLGPVQEEPFVSGAPRLAPQREHEKGRISQSKLEYVMNRLYGRFVYMPGATTVKTTAAEALSLGQGVCQDYAHVFISLCRLAGVPARYAAGMMLGEGASHAWAEVWLFDQWLGMDPTNNRIVDETYIKLTHGRDFGDGAIDRGCFLGFAGQSQEISVKVEEIL